MVRDLPVPPHFGVAVLILLFFYAETWSSNATECPQE